MQDMNQINTSHSVNKEHIEEQLRFLLNNLQLFPPVKYDVLYDFLERVTEDCRA